MKYLVILFNVFQLIDTIMVIMIFHDLDNNSSNKLFHY